MDFTQLKILSSRGIFIFGIFDLEALIEDSRESVRRCYSEKLNVMNILRIIVHFSKSVVISTKLHNPADLDYKLAMSILKLESFFVSQPTVYYLR